MKKYIIFDLDGTLIDSHTDIKKYVINFIKEKEPDYYDKIRYVFDFNKIATLKDLLTKVFKDEEKALKYTKKIYKHINTIRGETIFFKGVPEKIKELSKKYTLFLSTGSSTEFAKKTLKEGLIKKYFELIYGSDQILKGEEHLEIFAEYSNDKDFYKNSLSVGDGEMDEYYAKQKQIDFVRIGKKGNTNINTISSVVEIDNFLK